VALAAAAVALSVATSDTLSISACKAAAASPDIADERCDAKSSRSEVDEIVATVLEAIWLR
jgi:hypothetical protein